MVTLVDESTREVAQVDHHQSIVGDSEVAVGGFGVKGTEAFDPDDQD
jgi:hypothetical protein